MTSEQLAPPNGLVQAFAINHPSEFAAVLNRHAYSEVEPILQQLSPKCLPDLVSLLSQSHAHRFLSSSETSVIVEWLTATSLDTAARIVQRLPLEIRDSQLDAVANKKRRSQLRELVSIASDTVGTRIQTNFRWLSSDTTVARTLQEIQEHPDYVGPMFITNSEDLVIGIMDSDQLVHLTNDATIHSCTQSLPRLPAETPIRSVIDSPIWQTTRFLPVTDRYERAIGFVTREDLTLETVEQAAAEMGDNLVVNVAQTMFDSWSDLFVSLQSKKE